MGNSPPNHVSFRCSFSKERVGSDPPGSELADFLEQALETPDVGICERGNTDYSHTFDLGVGRRVFIGMLGLVEDGPREWLFFTQSTLGFFSRLFGASDHKEHWILVAAIDNALKKDSRFSEIRWYRDAENWNHGQEGDYLASPGA